jgi:hypothetical protein
MNAMANALAIAPMPVVLLAQLPQVNPPPPLPPGPFLERVLFEQPFGLVTGLALAAVVAFVILNRRGQARAGLISGATLALLAAGAYLLSAIVETPREQIARAARSLVDATAAADTRAIAPMLAPDARLVSRFRIPGEPIGEAGLDKEGIIAAVEHALGRSHPLKDHSVKEVQSQIDGPASGRTQVKVWVQLEMGVPNTSWWLIRWRRDGEQWRATSIEPLEIPFLGAGG